MFMTSSQRTGQAAGHVCRTNTPHQPTQRASRRKNFSMKKIISERTLPGSWLAVVQDSTVCEVYATTRRGTAAGYKISIRHLLLLFCETYGTME